MSEFGWKMVAGAIGAVVVVIVFVGIQLLGQAHAAEVVAAGDIATSGNGDTKTSDLILALAPDAVLTLGDNAYQSGTLSEYNSYYDPTWGRFFAITHPSPGNHEWKSAGASGYEAYFGVQAAQLHSFVIGDWLIVSMDSSKERPGQNSDLANLLLTDTHDCELLFWHHPRYSSGEHGNATSVEPWWKTASLGGVELVLNGHDHNYERFGVQRGIREFVVGTGGVKTRPFKSVKPGSQKRLTGNANWGVLDLELTPGSYTWQFRTATGGTGTVKDSGSASCA